MAVHQILIPNVAPNYESPPTDILPIENVCPFLFAQLVINDPPLPAPLPDEMAILQRKEREATCWGAVVVVVYNPLAAAVVHHTGHDGNPISHYYLQ